MIKVGKNICSVRKYYKLKTNVHNPFMLYLFHIQGFVLRNVSSSFWGYGLFESSILQKTTENWKGIFLEFHVQLFIKQLNYFKIYNRWGNLIFETTSGRPEDGWDGTYKGKKQPVETYTWVVEGIDIDNLVIRKNGNTLLIH